jgi:hypothetical protein
VRGTGQIEAVPRAVLRADPYPAHLGYVVDKVIASAIPKDSGWRTALPASFANALTVFLVASVVRQLVLSPRRWTSVKSRRTARVRPAPVWQVSAGSGRGVTGGG